MGAAAGGRSCSSLSVGKTCRCLLGLWLLPGKTTSYSEKPSVAVSIGSFSSDRMDSRDSEALSRAAVLFTESVGETWATTLLCSRTLTDSAGGRIRTLNSHRQQLSSHLLSQELRNHNSTSRYVRLCVFLCNLPLPVPHTMQHSAAALVLPVSCVPDAAD